MKKLIAALIVVAVFLVGFVIFQTKEKATQEDFYEEATVFFREEDYKKAIQYFEEAAEHNNLFSGDLKENLAYYQAEAYVKLDEYVDAMIIYDGLIKENPKAEIPYVMKAYCRMQQGKPEKAAEIYQLGYEKTKKGEFLYYLADLYVTMEDYEKALDVIQGERKMEKAVKQKLDFLEVIVYEKQLDYKQAYELASAYCEKYPDDEKAEKERIFLESRCR